MRAPMLAPLAATVIAACDPVPPAAAPPSRAPAPPAVTSTATPAPAPAASPSSTANGAQGARPVAEAEIWDALCDGPNAVPMEVAGSREFVNVTLSGPSKAATLRFHVDTGGNTPGLAVRAAAVAPLGFTSAESLPRTLRIADKDVAVPEGASWVLLDDGAGKDSARKDFSVGQIGAGFLSRFVVCIDPQKGRLGLTPAGSVAITGDTSSMAFVPVVGGPNKAVYPFVHLRITDAAGAFTGGYGVLLDSGATTTMLDANKVEYQAKKVATRPRAAGAAGDSDMVGGQWAESLLRVEHAALGTPTAYAEKKGLDKRPYVELGSALLVDRPTGTFDRMFGAVRETMGSHGAVANDVLLRFRLVIDYPHERLWLAPSGRAEEASASMTRVGVALAFRADGCPVVRQLTTTNDKATLAALAVGDVILKVDGADACQLQHHEISARLAGKVGDKKSLAIERAGAKRAVTAVVADLLRAP